MKASAYLAVSLDNFIAREDGRLDWLKGEAGTDITLSAGEDFGFTGFINSVDTVLMGRQTFDFICNSASWPYQGKRVVVLSHSLSKVPAGYEDRVELQCGPAAEIWENLVRSGVAHVYIDGGLTLQSFLKHELISELTLTRAPVLIGSGVPLFGSLQRDLQFRHLETTTYGNGFVQSRYRLTR